MVLALRTYGEEPEFAVGRETIMLECDGAGTASLLERKRVWTGDDANSGDGGAGDEFGGVWRDETADAADREIQQCQLEWTVCVPDVGD